MIRSKFLKKATASGWPKIAFDRREDMYRRYLQATVAEELRVRRLAARQQAAAGKSKSCQGGTATVGGGQGRGSRKKETDVMLKIGDLDLNFSDDEMEEEKDS